MIKQGVVRRISKLTLLLVVGTAMATNAQTSFAGNCGGHCQIAKMCGSMVSQKGVKGAQKRTEYQKCMMDPQGYK
jgi:hypothetical protein